MFDSALQDWRPGKVKVFGWPWHGRLDLPKTFGAFTPRVTLPNGVTFTLPINPLVPTGMHQSGSLVRFRDPRAVDPVRTSEELASDAAKGVEWRAEALYSPRDGIIYGKENFGGASSQASWVYHDGVTNWTANLESQSVRLRPMFRVSRHNPNYLNNEGVSIPLSFPDGPLGALSGTITNVVFDATATGDRAIVGRFSSNVNQRPPSNFINTDSGGLGYCTTVMDFFEVTLTNVAGVRTAEIRSLKNAEQTAGTILPRVEPVLNDSSFNAYIDWTLGEPVSPGSSDYYWEGVSVVEPDSFPPGTFTSGPIVPSAGSYNITYGYTGLTVSMYYRPDSTIASVTASCEIVENYTGSEMTFSATTATCLVRSDDSYPYGVYSEVLERGSISIEGTASRSWHQVTTLSLNNDGAEISGAELVSNSSGTLTFSLVYDVPGENSPLNEISYKSGSHTSLTEVSYIATAGAELASDSGSESTTGSGPNFVGISWPSPDLPTISGAWLSIEPAWLFNTSRPEFCLGPLRYCAQMPAGCMLLNPISGSTATTVSYRIGPGVLPYAGGSFGGSKSGTGKITEIFGSYNPVTQQFIRDASNPVSWV